MKKFALTAICGLVACMASADPTVIPLAPSQTDQVLFIETLEPNAQEAAALAFFEKYYPRCKHCKASQVTDKMLTPNLSGIGVIWMHCDRPELEQGVDNLLKCYLGENATRQQIDAFAGRLEKYTRWFTNIYLTGNAVQVLYATGRVNADDHPLVYDKPAENVTFVPQGQDNATLWSVNSNIRDDWHTAFPWEMGHAIYGHIRDSYTFSEYPLSYYDHNEDGVFPMLACESGQEFTVANNNYCFQTQPGKSTSDFIKSNHCWIAGVNDQDKFSDVVYDPSQFGIVEFACYVNGPTEADVYRPPYDGIAIANGLASCWKFDINDKNPYASNMEGLNFNTINYLLKSFHEGAVTAVNGITIDSSDDQQAPCQYYNLQGQPVSQPSYGNFYICRQGNKVSKIAF